jgi:hypothetical protein
VNLPNVDPLPPQPPPPAATLTTLTRRTSIEARLASEICEEASRVGDPVHMQLASALTLSDGTTIPVGASVTGKITAKRLNGSLPPLIELEASALSVGDRTMPIETNPFSFYMQRPSNFGSIAKGAVIGGAAGAVVGLILRSNVAWAAGIGAAVGGGAVAVKTSHDQACVSSNDTRFAFVLAKDASLR